MDKIIIEPLSQRTLKGALEVLDKVFGSDPDDKKWYTRAFHASLGDKKYQSAYSGQRPKYLQYFVAMDKKNDRVVGTTGLYAYKKELDDNAFSTGWFSVDPIYRGKGIGKLLLEFTIKEAKRLKRTLLRLWTSDLPDTEVARTMYKKRGFVITGTEKEKGKNYTTIYMELKL